MPSMSTTELGVSGQPGCEEKACLKNKQKTKNLGGLVRQLINSQPWLFFRGLVFSFQHPWQVIQSYLNPSSKEADIPLLAHPQHTRVCTHTQKNTCVLNTVIAWLKRVVGHGV